MKIVSVTFTSKRQSKHPQLTFPKKVARLLGIRSRQNVRVVIRKASGEILMDQDVQLRSGTEIYGAATVKPHLVSMRNKILWIEAWRPRPLAKSKKRLNSARISQG